MAAEVIQTIKGKEKKPENLGLNKSIELDTPAGKILVIGTQDGFAVKRLTEPGKLEAPDILYEHDGADLRINHNSGDTTMINALPKPDGYPLTPHDQTK